MLCLPTSIQRDMSFYIRNNNQTSFSQDDISSLQAQSICLPSQWADSSQCSVMIVSVTQDSRLQAPPPQFHTAEMQRMAENREAGKTNMVLFFLHVSLEDCFIWFCFCELSACISYGKQRFNDEDTKRCQCFLIRVEILFQFSRNRCEQCWDKELVWLDFFFPAAKGSVKTPQGPCLLREALHHNKSHSL